MIYEGLMDSMIYACRDEMHDVDRLNDVSWMAWVGGDAGGLVDLDHGDRTRFQGERSYRFEFSDLGIDQNKDEPSEPTLFTIIIDSLLPCTQHLFIHMMFSSRIHDYPLQCSPFIKSAYQTTIHL